MPPADPPTDPKPSRRSSLFPGGWLALVVLLGFMGLVVLVANNRRSLTLTQFDHLAAAGQIKKLTIVGRDRAVGEILDPDRHDIPPTAMLNEVTREMATYNLVSIPVTDEEGRLLGAVTVDDVLDHVLPDDWREQDEPSTMTGQIDLSQIARGITQSTTAPRNGRGEG